MKKTMLYSLSVVAMLAASSAFAMEQPAPMPPKGEPHKGGKMFEENDTNKDGFISKDEWRTRGDKMFSETDGNNDGKLSQDETKAHMEKKRAEWKERRAERKEKMGEMREKLQERKESNTAPATTPAVKQ